MKVADIVAEPIRDSSRSRGARRQRVLDLLRLVGLPETSADLHPHQFSGGQRQRIAIARALGPDPDVIVLDEPTSALDVSIRAQILNLLLDIQTRLGMTYLYISHDLASVAYMTKTIVVMHGGRIVEDGDTAATYSSPLHPYTWLLHASTPHFGDLDRLSRLERNVTPGPSIAVVGGCAFRSRCALWPVLGHPARCAEERPELREVRPGGRAACHFSESAHQLSDVQDVTPTPTAV
jgi:oligopeptide/dipeptide ABC transporter ATP-binding protein